MELDGELTPLLAAGENVVIFGYSQGGQVVSNEMRNHLAGLSQAMKDQLEIVMIGNIANPDGGLWPRLSPSRSLANYSSMRRWVRRSSPTLAYRPPSSASNTTAWSIPRSSGAIRFALLNAPAVFQPLTVSTWPALTAPDRNAAVRWCTQLAAALADPNNVRYGATIRTATTNTSWSRRSLCRSPI